MQSKPCSSSSLLVIKTSLVEPLRPANAGSFFSVLFNCQMTLTEAKSFPPVDDAIAFVKGIDWTAVRQRTRRGLNNVGLVVAVLGEKIHDFGAFLAQV